MPLPFSKNQVRNLGKRLRDAATPATDDLDGLAEVLAAYGDAMGEVGDRLVSLGLVSSERLKNTGTIVEKLRRDPGTNLPNIQDIAGRRVVLPRDAGRREQDDAVELIVSSFAASGHTPRTFDRRTTPSRGYRAVHVVVESLELPVEIQVRTAAQHEWAEYFERLADVWGRGIRYDGGRHDIGPLAHEAPSGVAASTSPARRQLAEETVAHALALADLIATLEDTDGADLPPELEDQLWTSVRHQLDRMRSILDAVSPDVPPLK